MFGFKKKKIDTEVINETIYKKMWLKRYAYFFVGLLLISIAFNAFLLPNNIVFGGVSGISIITKKFFGWDPSIFIMISSLLLLVVSFVFLGVKKTKGSIMGSIMFPIFIELTSNIPLYLNLDKADLLICAIFGGVLYGIGAGLVFKAGFTTGGTDIINQIISKYAKTSMGTSLILSDGLIVLCGVFVFGVTKLMYAIITLYIISLITDRVLLGISDSKAFYIIAEKDNEIKEYVLKELGHGVTIFEGKGGFSKEKQKVLFCVIPTKDYFKLKEGIHNIDSEAFFVVTDAYEVLGGE